MLHLDSMSTRDEVPRGIPAHKCVPGTGFVVDGFKFGNNREATAFFLTHAHGDHYGGIERWTREFYCTSITASVICGKFGIDRSLARTIDPGETVDVLGARVSAVDANHCPGAVQFLFDVGGERFVHSGDMRFHGGMTEDPLLRRFRGARALYLDTTYCHPSHSFPPQAASVDHVVRTILRREEQADERGPALFLIGSYNIGKERIFHAVARATGKKLYADKKKKAHLERLGIEELNAILTDDPASTNIHLVPWGGVGETWPFFRPNFAKLKEYRQEHGAEEAVAFVPSGWAYEGKGKDFSFRESGADTVHLVPYSEHSSYEELREYVGWIRPERVVPTVNLGKDGVGGKECAKMLRHFRNLVDEGASKRRFLQAFGVEAARGRGGDVEAESPGARDAKKVASARAGEGNWPSEEGPCRLLMSSTGIESLLEAEALLRSAGGSVEMAANMYFDKPAARPKKSAEKKRKAPQKKGILPGQMLLSSLFSGRSSCQTTATGPSKNANGPPEVIVLDEGAPVDLKSDLGGVRDTPGEASTRKLKSTPTKLVSAFTPLKAKPAVTPEELLGTRFYEEEAENGPAESCRSPCWKTATGPSNNAIKTHEMIVLDGGSGSGSVEELPEEAATRKPTPTKVVSTFKPVEAITREKVPNTYVDKEETEYSPAEDAMWKEGTPCPYLHLAAAFELVTATKKRLLIRRYVTNMFRSILALSPESTVAAIYLTIGRLGPEHEKLELGIGGSTVAQCVSDVTGASRQRLRNAYKEEGDMGDVACLFKRSQRTLLPLPILTVDKVIHGLQKIHSEGGGGSVQRKQAVAKTMIRSCRGPETRYLVRTLLQCMRIGANRTSVLQALARAAVYHHEGAAGAPPTEERLKAAVKRWEETYNLHPDIEALVPILVAEGIDAAAASCKIKAGVPLKPMLAKPSTGIKDAVGQMRGEAFIAESKYDGQRCQIQHFDKKTRLWSRNLEEKTTAFPDAVQIFQDALGPSISSIVVDCEIVGVERSAADYRLLSFQELSSRPRREVAGPKGAAVDVALFVFDVMQVNGVPLVDQPLSNRLAQIGAALPGRKKGLVEIAHSVIITAPKLCDDASQEEILASQEIREAATQEALVASLRAGCEGVMLKPLRGPYEPGKRSDNWIKLKKDYVEGMQESLDLVVIGAWHGNGRKAGWYSPYLLAAYDPEREEYQSVCRVMSGFSDEFYKETKAFFDGRLIDRPKPYYNTGESCSVWFEPTVVWEIRGADITVSPVHRAALGRVHPGRGLALRFPRFIRPRQDKIPEEATTAEQLLEMFHGQNVKWMTPATESPLLELGVAEGAARGGVPAVSRGRGEGESL